MENRWLVLLVTVLVAASSFAIFRTRWFEQVEWAASTFGTTTLNRVGVNLSVSLRMVFHPASGSFALLWFYPLALRLGVLRTSIWMLLAGIGGGLTILLDSFFETTFKTTEPLFVINLAIPALAMVGKRTNPWMALMAAIAFAAAESNPRFGYGFVWAAVGSLPYAAILIFGTKLIPKRAATELPVD
jgi:hypothetical protein